MKWTSQCFSTKAPVWLRFIPTVKHLSHCQALECLQDITVGHDWKTAQWESSRVDFCVVVLGKKLFPKIRIKQILKSYLKMWLSLEEEFLFKIIIQNKIKCVCVYIYIRIYVYTHRQTDRHTHTHTLYITSPSIKKNTKRYQSQIKRAGARSWRYFSLSAGRDVSSESHLHLLFLPLHFNEVKEWPRRTARARSHRLANKLSTAGSRAPASGTACHMPTPHPQPHTFIQLINMAVNFTCVYTPVEGEIVGTHEPRQKVISELSYSCGSGFASQPTIFQNSCFTCLFLKCFMHKM